MTFSLCLFTVELSKHKRYEIRMSVYNAVGEGPTSPPQEVFVGEAGACASFHFYRGSRSLQPLCSPAQTCFYLGVLCLFFNPGAFLFQLKQYRRFAALNCNAAGGA